MRINNYFQMEKPASLIVALRMGILAAVLTVASLKMFSGTLAGDTPVFFYLAGLFTTNLLLLIPFRDGEPPHWLVIAQLILDVALISFIVLLTGGPSSPFGYLYLPVVFIAGFALGSGSSLVIALSSISLHSGTLLVSALYFGENFKSVPLNISALTVAVFVIVALSRFVRRWAEQALSSATQKEEENRDLAKKAEESSQKLSSLEESIRKQEAFARSIAEQSPAINLRGKECLFKTESPLMKKVLSVVERVAASDATLLIQGESGTGKERIAVSIHKMGVRSNRPFIPVNCGAIPSELIESELFGHKKGSFTGAVSDNPGLIRSADGGTLFLDEIGDLPLPMQVKLLRVLQEKSVRPVGSNEDIPVNVRIIAATHKDIKELVRKGEFREDLYYRLNVVQLTLPPLRERKEDIPLIIREVGAKFLPEGRELIMSPYAMEKLLAYDYPGNIRELENILERAWVLGGGAVLPEHIPGDGSKDGEDPGPMKKATEIIESDEVAFPCNLDDILGAMEKHYLKLSLEKAATKKEAATLLGMNFRSFRYRLEKFGIDSSGE